MPTIRFSIRQLLKFLAENCVHRANEKKRDHYANENQIVHRSIAR